MQAPWAGTGPYSYKLTATWSPEMKMESHHFASQSSQWEKTLLSLLTSRLLTIMKSRVSAWKLKETKSRGRDTGKHILVTRGNANISINQMAFGAGFCMTRQSSLAADPGRHFSDSVELGKAAEGQCSKQAAFWAKPLRSGKGGWGERRKNPSMRT